MNKYPNVCGCPFCGAEVSMIKTLKNVHTNIESWTTFISPKCNCSQEIWFRCDYNVKSAPENQSEAIRVWNRRPETVRLNRKEKEEDNLTWKDLLDIEEKYGCLVGHR